jgi:hypothetical protein
VPVRYWTCKCGTRYTRRKALCACGGRRPTRPTAAQKALSEPYEAWVERFGEACNICGALPSAKRRLDRDHDHRTGRARGVLCVRCNRGLPAWVTAEWLRAAADYLERAAAP